MEFNGELLNYGNTPSLCLLDLKIALFTMLNEWEYAKSTCSKEC